MSATRKALPRRPVDRLEDALAWLMMVLVMALVLGSVLTGVAVQVQESRRAVAEQESRTMVSAVLLEDAIRDGDSTSSALPVRVPARWTGSAGEQGTAVVLAPLGARAGTEIDAWLDEAGQSVGAPADRTEVVMAAVLAGFSLLAMGSMVLAGFGLGIEQLVERLRRRYWEREWARVEPMWRPGHSADQS